MKLKGAPVADVHPSASPVKVLSYVDVLKHGAPVGRNVAIIGAGGIGFDVAEFLSHYHDPVKDSSSQHAHSHSFYNDQGAPAGSVDETAVASYLQEWNIDPEITRGGLKPAPQEVFKADRKIYLLQRKVGKLGEGLGKTTGWVHRTTMKKRGVVELDGCSYKEVTDSGLLIEHKGQSELLEVDTIVICAGQEPLRDLFEACKDDVSSQLRIKCLYYLYTFISEIQESVYDWWCTRGWRAGRQTGD